MTTKENIFWLFRCTEYKYAKLLKDKGCIKFNTAYNWIEMEKNEGKGRGDVYEGVYGFTKIHDLNNVLNFRTLRKNVVCETSKENVYFRSSDILEMPSYCLFALSDKSFSNNYFSETNCWATTTIIGQEYFKDFYKNVTRESIVELPSDERPVVAIIQSPNRFFNKIYEYFESIGVLRSEVIIKKIDYIDKKQPFIVRDDYPVELFLKDNSFKHQSELRIVINTTNAIALKKLEHANNIINLGDLSDIVIIHEYYLEDMFIELRNNKLRYVLPVPEVSYLDDLSKEEILKIIDNVENSEYIEKYEKEYIRNQISIILSYYEERFNEKLYMCELFWKKIQI